jgi:hypothetical protein
MFSISCCQPPLARGPAKRWLGIYMFAPCHGVAHSWHAVAHGVHQDHLGDLAAAPQVGERDGDDAGGLVRRGARGGEHAAAGAGGGAAAGAGRGERRGGDT